VNAAIDDQDLAEVAVVGEWSTGRYQVTIVKADQFIGHHAGPPVALDQQVERIADDLTKPPKLIRGRGLQIIRSKSPSLPTGIIHQYIPISKHSERKFDRPQ
jgi:hypothetical protein